MPGSKLTADDQQPTPPARPRRIVNRRRPSQPSPFTAQAAPAPAAEPNPAAAQPEPKAPPAPSPHKPKRQPVGPQKIGPLAFTEGPEPDAPVQKVRLAVGTIVGAHGVDG